jgi:hypothetical protein
MIPGVLQDVSVLKHVLRDWEASGVSTFMTGSNVNPTCNTNVSGVSNTDPSLSNAQSVRCELVPGQDIDDIQPWTGDPNTHEAFRPHFNLAAFQRPKPTAGGTQGNLGNSAQGQLRHPGWQNWDFTLARRIPVNIGRGGSLRVQAQFYNVWNLVQFQRMAATYTFGTPTATNPSGNTNTTTGQYDEIVNPFNFGITIRMDY